MLTTFLALGRHGRLGNQLFQIGATIGAARRNDCDYVFPEWEYSSYFAHELPRSETIIVEATHVEPEFSYNPIDISVSTDLRGYYQSEKYFKHCESELRQFLTPGEKLERMINECRQKTFFDLEGEKTCSVCVRRGDYVWKSGFFLDLAETWFYVNALERFGRETEFVVFSDDIDWCRDYFKDERFGGYRFTFTTPPHELVGLFLMASCRDHIIANSTFPWWGAWLNPSVKKRVIAPDAWFVGTGLDRGQTYHEGGYHDTGDLIPDTWEKVHVGSEDK